MKSPSNVGAERLGDALGESIDDGARLSIISSYFTVFAYGELKEELSKIDEVRSRSASLPSSSVWPTLRSRASSRSPAAREVGVGGSELELTLRNTLNLNLSHARWQVDFRFA